MLYGSKGATIEKLASFGASLSVSGTSGYTFFLITVSWVDDTNTRRYHSYPYVKGFTLLDFSYIGDYWYEIKTYNSGNTINISLRRSNKLSSSVVNDPYTVTVEKI